MKCPACGFDRNAPGADACANCELPLARLDEYVPQGPVEQSLTGDTIAVLDPRAPVTVAATAPLRDAMRQLIAARIGALLVTDSAGALVGILTERDFLTKVAGAPGFETEPVSAFMTRDPETVAPNDRLAVALGKMDAGGYRHLPVVDGGKPVGVISVRDVLRHLTALTPEG
jgi:CBS domain-containing protein